MTIEKIACCVDFSENAEVAFGRAVEIAKKFHAKLYVVHVLPPVVNPVLADSGWVLPDVPKRSLISKVKEMVQQKYGP